MNETARVVFGSVEVCTGKYPVGSGQWVANDGRKSKQLGQRSQTIFFSLNDGALLDQQLSINQSRGELKSCPIVYIKKPQKISHYFKYAARPGPHGNYRVDIIKAAQ